MDDDLPLPLNPTLMHGELNNGLKYYIVGSEGSTSRIAFCRLVVNVGSLVEEEARRGAIGTACVSRVALLLFLRCGTQLSLRCEI